MRTPLRPLARVLDAREKGENPDVIEAEERAIRNVKVQMKMRRRAESRLLVLGVFFFFCFSVVGVRMSMLAASEPHEPVSTASIPQIANQRADIVDRNGEVLATNLATTALYAQPPLMVDPKEAAKGLGEIPPMSYEAILLPEGGTALRSLAPLFPYYDVDPAKVQFLGTGLWKNDETVREPALNGGIFAAADQDAKQPFLDNYDRTYGDDASRLASLAYDAVAVGAYVADGDPRGRRYRAEDPSGFYGVDGLVRFNPDGTPDRGLAVYQIKNGRFVIIDPAPKTVVGPS